MNITVKTNVESAWVWVAFLGLLLESLERNAEDTDGADPRGEAKGGLKDLSWASMQQHRSLRSDPTNRVVPFTVPSWSPIGGNPQHP